jgi:fatty-acid peroxygenase
VFRPDRSLDWRHGGFDFVPQGGGDCRETHRCPGEAATVALVSEAVRLLSAMDWRMPPQDLGVDLSRIPARPASGVVLDQIGTIRPAPATMGAPPELVGEIPASGESG